MNPNVTFPPGFPFRELPRSFSGHLNLGMAFPFGAGSEVNFEGENRAGRRAHMNRNYLRQIFDLNNEDFDTLFLQFTFTFTF